MKNSSSMNSVMVFENHRVVQDKYDYYVVGAIGGLCAYVSQNLQAERLGFSPNTLELLAVLALILSAIAGFTRLRYVVMSYYFDFQMMQCHEMRSMYNKLILEARASGLSDPKVIFADGEQVGIQEMERRASNSSKEAERWSKTGDEARERGKKYYSWRDRLLLLGALGLIAAKVWKPYAFSAYPFI